MECRNESVSTISLFGIRIAQLTVDETVCKLRDWMRRGGPCQYVVTPNLNHVVLLRSDAALRAAYEHASLAIADGWPLVTTSRWLGTPLPERVAGSDVVPKLFDAVGETSGTRVFLLGAAPGVAERARARIRARWPHLEVCGCYSPPPGFEYDAAENDSIVAAINRAAPDLLVVGLGAPRQEIWLQRHAGQLNVPLAIAGGATIDFLAGEQRRAPRWVQLAKLEWLFRILTDPRRLAKRYLYDAVRFPLLLAGELARSTSSSATRSQS